MTSRFFTHQFPNTTNNVQIPTIEFVSTSYLANISCASSSILNVPHRKTLHMPELLLSSTWPCARPSPHFSSHITLPEVSTKLLISIRDAENMPAGRVRAYVSGLYQEVYDAAYAAKRPHLDVRVLLPKEAASGAGTVTRASRASATVIPTATTAPRSVEASVDNGGPWATKYWAELEPDMEVLLSDEPPAGEQVGREGGRGGGRGFD